MVFSRTILRVCDNSGAKYVKALCLWGDTSRKYGLLCDPLLVVPKKLRRRIKRAKALLQKRKKYIGVVVTTVWNTRRRDGSFIKFLSTSVALFNMKQKMLGTSVKAPLSKEFKLKHSASPYNKILARTRLFL